MDSAVRLTVKWTPEPLGRLVISDRLKLINSLLFNEIVFRPFNKFVHIGINSSLMGKAMFVPYFTAKGWSRLETIRSLYSL